MKLKNFKLLITRLETMLDDPEQVGRFDMGQFGRPFAHSDSSLYPFLFSSSACM